MSIHGHDPTRAHRLLRALRLVCPATPVLLAAACASLNYPTDEASEVRNDRSETAAHAPLPESAPAIAEAALSTSAPAGAESAAGVSEPTAQAMAASGLDTSAPALDETGEADAEEGRAWYELTRLAREKRQVGKFEAASELLDQAALQLSGRPSSNAQRRTVHGMRARLALDLYAIDRREEAEALAERLFTEVQQEPALGGPAMIDLARTVANRRAAHGDEDARGASPLPLIRIAFQSAESANPSRDRMELAYEVALEAEREGDPALALAAIDRALSDARVVESANLEQQAGLGITKTRIALASGAIREAETAAAASNRLLAEMEAPPIVLAIGEATMAHAVARAGDGERARAIGRTAMARLESTPDARPEQARRVLGELARMERALGEIETARDRYSAALALPATDDASDVDLTRQLREDLTALDDPDDASQDRPRPERDEAE